MNPNQSAFVRRARFFLSELRRDSYPNSTSLQRFDGCSRSTAARVIERLQTEFGFPIVFMASERGYSLTDPSFTCEFLPPGKDELCALFLISQLADTVGDDELRSSIASLWQSVAAGSSILRHDMRALENVFSADVTAVSMLADSGVLDLMKSASTGTHVTVEYKSPWRHVELRSYSGIIERVHMSDGAVYVMFRREDGRRLVLNASFIKTLRECREPLNMKPTEESDTDLAWLDGFGVWASAEVDTVTITILPPAAEYYALQRWHYDQVDTWQDGKLVRTFPSMLSPELVRRILSLGRYVGSVQPAALATMVGQEVRALSLLFDGTTSITS